MKKPKVLADNHLIMEKRDRKIINPLPLIKNKKNSKHASAYK